MSHAFSGCRQPVCCRAALFQVPTGCKHSERSGQSGPSSRRLSPVRARPREPLQIQICEGCNTAGTELSERPVGSEVFEMSIDAMGPGQNVFSAVYTSRAEMSPQPL